MSPRAASQAIVTDFTECPKCSGLTGAISDLKENFITEKADNKSQHEAQWKAIDRMTSWVIGGMGALILAAFTWFLSLIHVIKIGG
jgi:hypothetical protein